ncbi:unnamed protein product [Lactuca saligna]|uniref:Uncharacterized protein n=1 Tax=Lactuca saligna TaxID=75948 RepID=A0AA36ELV5_LACSI|nr:unnamed protein product [Lactuca saligna]
MDETENQSNNKPKKSNQTQTNDLQQRVKEDGVEVNDDGERGHNDSGEGGHNDGGEGGQYDIQDHDQVELTPLYFDAYRNGDAINGLDVNGGDVDSVNVNEVHVQNEVTEGPIRSLLNKIRRKKFEKDYQVKAGQKCW